MTKYKIPLIVGAVVILLGAFILTKIYKPVAGSYFGAIQLMDAETGLPKSVTFNAEGLRVLAQDYLQGLAEGDISGHTPFVKYGRVGSVGTTALDVISWGGTYSFPAAAGIISVSSTSAADNSSGIGIKTIQIQGLASDYSATTSNINLSGTTTVTGTINFLRVNTVIATAVGTGGVASGTIKVYIGTSQVGQIDLGLTQSRQLVYTVPLGKTLYITSVRGSCGIGYLAGANTSKETYTTFTTRATYNGTNTTTFFVPYNEIGIGTGMFYLPLEMPTKLPATTDLKVSVQGDVANSVACQAALRGWLE